jgi:hypothetical protein
MKKLDLKKLIRECINEIAFSPEEKTAFQEIKQKLQFPYVGIQYTSLGGEERASFMVTVSIQPKVEWQNGILQNSQYSIFRVNKGPIGYVVENFSGSLPKFRKFNAKTLEELINKLNIYHSKVSTKSPVDLKEIKSSKTNEVTNKRK